MLDVGTWIGGVLTGHISDKLGKRGLLISPMLLISAILVLMV